jgi:pimeloyl-ACP methyl ester carboxylesterase
MKGEHAMTVRTNNYGKPSVMIEDLGDAKLPYLLYIGSGPTIIFLHATGFLPWLWHPIAREFSPPYTVIAPYICDYRKAEPEKGALPWLTVAQDIAELCRRNALENVVMVGHSMGATVLTLAAALSGVTAKAMILIEPIFLYEDFYNFRFTADNHPLASKSLKRTNHWRNAAEARDYLKAKDLFNNWTEEMQEFYITYGMKERKGGGLELVCSPQTEAALFLGGVQYNVWPIIPDISCPTLIITGGMSDSKQYIDLERAVSLFPKASHITIADAGHLIPMEQPEKITAVIRDFFGNL